MYNNPRISIITHKLYTYRSKAMPGACWCGLWTPSLGEPFESACSSWVRQSTCAPFSTVRHPGGTPSRVPAWCRSEPTSRTPPISPCAMHCKEHATRTCRASACRAATTTSDLFVQWIRRRSCLSTAAGNTLQPAYKS